MVAELMAPADDPLPEDTFYRDTGCKVAPSCLACPLALCIFDRPGTPSERRRDGRDRLVRLLYERGWPPARIARQFGISTAQVRRIGKAGTPA